MAFNLKTLCIVYKASKMFEIKENSVVTSFSAVWPLGRISKGGTVPRNDGHTRLHTSVELLNFESPEKPDGTFHLALDQWHRPRVSQDVY